MRRLLKVAAIAAITLASMEATLHAFNHFHRLFFLPGPSSDRFRGTPYALDFEGFRLNSHGFRDLEFTPEKPRGVTRIAAIGDSFVFGVVPYRQHFLTLLEERLNRSGGRYEVLSMGVPGATPGDYLRLLGQEALPLGPDEVLCFVYVGNDFFAYPYDDWQLFLPPFLHFVFIVLPRIPVSVTERVYRDDEATYPIGEYRWNVRGLSWMFRAAERASVEQGAVEVADVLDQMKRACERAAVRFRAVVIPQDVQVEESVRRKVFAPDDAATLDLDAPDRILGAALRARGISTYDLLPGLRRAAEHERLYKPQDGHWGIAGNRAAADLLARDVFQMR